MNKTEEKIENFNQIIQTIEGEIDKEINESDEFAKENLNSKSRAKTTLMNKIWHTIISGLLGNFKVKITLYYREKIIFEYEIPKD